MPSHLLIATTPEHSHFDIDDLKRTMASYAFASFNSNDLRRPQLAEHIRTFAISTSQDIILGILIILTPYLLFNWFSAVLWSLEDPGLTWVCSLARIQASTRVGSVTSVFTSVWLAQFCGELKGWAAMPGSSCIGRNLPFVVFLKRYPLTKKLANYAQISFWPWHQPPPSIQMPPITSLQHDILLSPLGISMSTLLFLSTYCHRRTNLPDNIIMDDLATAHHSDRPQQHSLLCLNTAKHYPILMQITV